MRSNHRTIRRVAAATMVPICAALCSAQTTHYIDGSCGDDAWTGLNAVCAAPDGPKRTIQAGIDASVSGDTVIVANGTYTGVGNRDISCEGLDIVLRSESGDPNLCIIDCEGSYGSRQRGFTFDGVIVFEGFTVRDSYTGSGDAGGAIKVLGGTATITNCQFLGNRVKGAGGGAIWMSGGGTIQGCVFSDNRADGFDLGYGGALYVASGDPAIIECVFVRNRVDAMCFTEGGAIFSRGSPSIIECEFRSNMSVPSGSGCARGEAAVGGALSGSFSVIENCSFVDNIADASVAIGGALATTAPVTNCLFSGNRAYGYWDTSSGGAADGGGPFTNCTFIGNRAGYGGGASSSQSFVNCLFIRNWAGHSGGALNAWGGSTITNCTFVGNEAGGRGDAVYGDAFISNCIVWGNIGPPLHGATLAYSCIDVPYAGIGVINLDPRFANPASGDYRLLSGSPAIDAADNTALPPGVITDLDGNPRFVDDPHTLNTGVPGNGFAEIVDMGAYEFQGESCYADCDQSGVLDLFDFLCFQNAFVTGCPWHRASDWVPGGAQGTTINNPGPGPQGRPVWSYVWSYEWTSGEPLGSPSPWYAQATQRSTWDEDWFGIGQGAWSQDDDVNPPIFQNRLTHGIAAASWADIPIVRWLNPVANGAVVDLAGSLTVRWSGEGGVGSPVDVDVVIAMSDASQGVWDVLFSATVSKPIPQPTIGDEIILPISLEGIALDEGDSIVISHRAVSDSGLTGRWVILMDDVTITGPALGCYADCDGSGTLDIFDFLCFQNAFVGGCP